MILVIVEHFLTEDGKIFFPEWLKLAENELIQYQGFIKIQKIDDVENDQRSLILLQFDKLENLKNWSKSEIHDNCLEQLKPYMIQKQKSQIFHVQS